MLYSDDWSVAVHEAGHVIVSLEYGRSVDEAKVMGCGPCGDKLNCYCGVTRHKDLIPSGTLEAAAIYMAGHVAIEILYNRELDIEETGSASDYVTLSWNRLMYGGMPAPAGQERAREILLARWDDVLAVAAALREKSSLTGEEINVILRKVKKAA